MKSHRQWTWHFLLSRMGSCEPRHFPTLTALDPSFWVSESLTGHLQQTLPQDPSYWAAAWRAWRVRLGRTCRMLWTSLHCLCSGCLASGSRLRSLVDSRSCKVPPSSLHWGSQNQSGRAGGYPHEELPPQGKLQASHLRSNFCDMAFNLCHVEKYFLVCYVGI